MLAEMRAMASELLTRSRIASLAGITYTGKRDLFEALGYKRVLSPKDFRDRYIRGGISARIVEAFPKATWRGGAEIVEDEDPEVSTPFEEAWAELDKRLAVWPKFQKADVLAGLGRYAVLLIGAPGPTEEPLADKINAEDVVFLQPYWEDEAEVDSFIGATDDPRFGLPEFYHLQRSSNAPRAKLGLDKRVHWTRIIHIADQVLDDNVYGQPRMERVWNYLDDLDKCVGSGSEAFWKRVHKGLVFSIDKDVKVEQPEIDKLKEESEEFANDMRRTIAAKGFTVTDLGGDVTPFTAQVMSIISLVSGATEIPQRLLLGSERGQLASTQDKRNWDDRVQSRRDDVAEPWTRQLVDRLLDHGALPEVEEYRIKWPEIDDLTDSEKAEVAGKMAELNKKAGALIVKPSEIRDSVLGLEPLTDEEIQEYEDNKPAPPPPPPGAAPPPPQPPVPPKKDKKKDDGQLD